MGTGGLGECEISEIVIEQSKAFPEEAAVSN
jgi:hypothetical protein